MIILDIIQLFAVDFFKRKSMFCVFGAGSRITVLFEQYSFSCVWVTQVKFDWIASP